MKLSNCFMILLCSLFSGVCISDESPIPENKYKNSEQAFFIANNRPAMIIGYSCEPGICTYSVRTVDDKDNLVLIEDVREYELYVPSDNVVNLTDINGKT